MLNLDDLIHVTVSLSGIPVGRDGFTAACIAGASGKLPADTRARTYTSAAALLDDGFTADSPEYKAAALYFAQSPRPARVVVAAKSASESWAECATACAAASAAWYLFYPCALLTKTEAPALAAAIEATNRACVLDMQDDDVLAALSAAKYARTLAFYTTSAYAGAALCGFAMGANDGTANSAFTLAYKPLAGVTADSLTDAQLSAVRAKNGNAYVNRAGVYSTFERGVMTDGEPFDTRLGLDQLAESIRLAVANLLCATKTKVPQTETGMTQLKTAVAAECAKAVRTGFLGDGVWTQPDLLTLRRGDAIPGFVILSERLDDQTAADRAARKAPPIYAALKLAGAVESVVVKVVVDR